MPQPSTLHWDSSAQQGWLITVPQTCLVILLHSLCSPHSSSSPLMTVWFFKPNSAPSCLASLEWPGAPTANTTSLAFSNTAVSVKLSHLRVFSNRSSYMGQVQCPHTFLCDHRAQDSRCWLMSPWIGSFFSKQRSLQKTERIEAPLLECITIFA